MGFFQKLFRSPRKEAQAAEAAGKLEEAIRLYAEIDAWADVVRIQLVRARLEGDARARLDILRAATLSAARIQKEDPNALRRLKALIAEDLLSTAQANGGGGTDLDRRLLAEAVELGTSAGAHATVGEALVLLGRREEAAQAFAQAGQIERMESLYQALATERGAANRIHDAFSAYELGLKTGDRLGALDAIRRCQDLAPRERRYADLRADVEERLLPEGVIPLRVGGQRVCLVGKLPADVGREAGCRVLLREPSVSRAHARLQREAEGWVLRDLGSRNGTYLNGVRIHSPLPLRERGAVRLGEYATFSFTEEESALRLLGTQGLDRDTEFVLFTGEYALAALPGARFSLAGEHAAVAPIEGARLLLNGQAIATAVVLLDGDVLRVGEAEVRVRRALTES